MQELSAISPSPSPRDLEYTSATKEFSSGSYTKQHGMQYGKGEDTTTKTFSPLEFLAELSVHIPRVFEQTYRMYGEYSPRTRGKRRREEQHREFIENNFEEPEYEPPPRGVSASWARCIKRVFEVDPLACEKCGHQMRILAFLQNPSEIERIAQNLRYPTWRAPPSIAREQEGQRIDSSAEFNQTLQ